MAKSKLVKANEKIAEGVTTGFKKMSDGVTSGFKKMSDGVVEGYTKIEDKFVDQFLTKDGETVSDAKARLKEEEKMIQIRQLKLMPGHSDRELTEKAARVLRIRPEEIASLRVVRQSIDARKKPEIRLIYTVDVKLVGAREEKVLLSCRKNPDVGPAPEVRYRFPEPGKEVLAERPIIIGTGPAGLFCG